MDDWMNENCFYYMMWSKGQDRLFTTTLFL
jgi:hypothetical protein